MWKQIRKEEKKMDKRRRGDADDDVNDLGIDPQIWKEQRCVDMFC